MCGDRRDHFTAEAELKKLANGFIRGELYRNLERETLRLDELKAMAKNHNSPTSDFFQEWIKRIGHWRRRGGMLLKIVKNIVWIQKQRNQIIHVYLYQKCLVLLLVKNITPIKPTSQKRIKK